MSSSNERSVNLGNISIEGCFFGGDVYIGDNSIVVGTASRGSNGNKGESWWKKLLVYLAKFASMVIKFFNLIAA